MEAKTANAIASTFPSSTNDETTNSRSLLKIYGIKKTNYYALFQKDIIHLTSYIISISATYTGVHNVMSFLRILQYLLPCLIPSYVNYWVNGTVDKITINAVSVLFSFIPSSAFFSCSHYLLISYIIIQAIMTIIVISSSCYFKKYSKLPNFISTFIYLYQSTLGYYLCPIIAYQISQSISYLATNSPRLQTSKLTLSLLLFFSILCLSFNVLFIFIDVSQNLDYRPISFASTTPVPQFLIFVMTIIINALFGFGVNFSKKVQIILFSFNVLFYIFTGFSVFLEGGYIQTYIANIILSSSITGACFTILDIIFISLNKKGSLAIFFAFIIFAVLMLILDFLLFQNITIRQLKLLDSIQADNSLFSYIKSPNQFCSIAACGIKFAHPIIIDSSFFILGTERWNDQFVFLIYAKFVAIYPEEKATLRFVVQSITVNKVNSLAIRCIDQQAKSIMKQRESELTPQLEKKLNQIKKQNQSAKHKLEHVWDVVILGNINEIEVALKGALSAINETESDIKRLLVEYPNNRYVTHYYSSFLNEVIGDHNLAKIYHDRTKALQPGIIGVNNDHMHICGLKMFPTLPNSISKRKDMIFSSDDINGPVGLSSNFNLDIDQDKQSNLDVIAGIKRNIEDLKIPSITGTKVIRILTTLCIIVIPSIAMFIYVNYFVNYLIKPLDFIASLSLLRTYTFHIIAFAIRFLGESLSIFPKIDPNERDPPEAFGNTWDTREQLEHILNETTNVLRDFDKYRNFEEKNYYIRQAHDLVFQNTVPYKSFSSPMNSTTSNISIQAAIIDLTIQLKSFVTGRTINASILNTGNVLNLFNNAYPITNNIHSSVLLIFQFLASNYNIIKKYETLLFVILIIVVIIIYSITMTVQIKWMNSNKKEIYQCLFSLPKNVVSNLAENKNSNKKENQVEDMDKQTDNIIRTFSSYGTYNISFSGVFSLIIGTCFIVAISISCITLFLHLAFSLSSIIINSAPYLHYVLASYSMLLSSVNWMNILLFEFGGHPMPTMDFNTTYLRMKTAFQWSNYYYHILVTGSEYTERKALKQLTQAMQKASPQDCSITHTLNKKSSKLLSQFHELSASENINFHEFKKKYKLINSANNIDDLLDCPSTEMLLVLIQPIIMHSIYPYELGIIDSLDPKMPEYTKIWRLLISPLYDHFYEPLHDQIHPNINNEMRRKKIIVIPIIVVLVILSIIIEIILFFQVLSIENYIRSILKLLLHCSPSVIFSSAKITRILAGDFSGQQNESFDHNDSFFDTVFTNLPDATMYANSDMIIQSTNIQCKRVFGDVNLVGKSITDFFMSDKFSGNVENLFTSVDSNPIEEIEYKSDSNTDMFLKVTSMMASGKFVMICQDVTQAHNYNTLILTEKQNSDKLLETILPPSLVSRVQQGEKNISLSVQSASILFSDIVSFTPWCGSLPAEKVMSTLNILFKRMDSILDTKPTMTKIKCIGDCYMAAGGIFAELNQPSLHAKEVVSFGLRSIKEVILINKEIHENLRIRVGVNTGGPIVAGVLGIGKPTFEIIGPAINRAQQMEQNGVPMKVHISNSVYELICGLNFKFSTRRTIECKNEKVETYLVEP